MTPTARACALLGVAVLIACGDDDGGPPAAVVERSVAELGLALERGTTTSRELVDRHLARIDAYDRAGPSIRALIATDPERARSRASALDDERRGAGGRGPLPRDPRPPQGHDRRDRVPDQRGNDPPRRFPAGRRRVRRGEAPGGGGDRPRQDQPRRAPAGWLREEHPGRPGARPPRHEPGPRGLELGDGSRPDGELRAHRDRGRHQRLDPRSVGRQRDRRGSGPRWASSAAPAPSPGPTPGTSWVRWRGRSPTSPRSSTSSRAPTPPTRSPSGPGGGSPTSATRRASTRMRCVACGSATWPTTSCPPPSSPGEPCTVEILGIVDRVLSELVGLGATLVPLPVPEELLEAMGETQERFGSAGTGRASVLWEEYPRRHLGFLRLPPRDAHRGPVGPVPGPLPGPAGQQPLRDPRQGHHAPGPRRGGGGRRGPARPPGEVRGVPARGGHRRARLPSGGHPRPHRPRYRAGLRDPALRPVRGPGSTT